MLAFLFVYLLFFFLQRISVFLAKIVPLLRVIVWEVRFFNSVFSFCNIKGYFQWKSKFYRLYTWSTALAWLLIGRKLNKNNDVTWSHFHLFWRCFVSVVKFSYWFKFHLNIITSFGVMIIFFSMTLTRNREIGNTPVWVLSNI